MFGYIYKKDVAIIAAVLCLCLGVGSFFDYQISSALFNIGSMYGRFVEAAGELPFELTASIAGVMLVRAARPDSKASKWLAALGVFDQRGSGRLRDRIGSLRVGGKLIAVQLVLTFALVIAANLRRLPPHAHDRARRAHALGVDGAGRVGRSGHHPQRHC